MIGFSPGNKTDTAMQRESGKTRKISDAEQVLSRSGISRFVSAKGQIVDIFNSGSLKTAIATKKVNGHGCVSVKLSLQKQAEGYIWPRSVPPCWSRGDPVSRRPGLPVMCGPSPDSSGMGAALQVRGVHSSMAADSLSR